MSQVVEVVDTVKRVSLDRIIPTPDNRRVINPDDPALLDLSAAIKVRGQLQPGVARPHPKKKGYYDLRAGARRWRACNLAGLDTMLINVIDLDDKAALEVTVMENLQRSDLTPMEEAWSISDLLDLGELPEVIAADIGKSLTWVVRRAQLTALIPEWAASEDEYGNGISVAVKELVARFPEDVQQSLWEDVKSQAWLLQPGSFGEFKNWIAEQSKRLKLAAWDLDDAVLVPEAGACSACPKRSSCNPGLFDDDLDPKTVNAADQCLDAQCWAQKQATHNERRLDELRADHPDVLTVATESMDWETRQSIKVDLQKYDFEKVKKDHPQARPALVLHGPNAGKQIWIRKLRQSDHGAGGKEKSAGPKSMEQKRELLECRRKAWVLETLAAALEGEGQLLVAGEVFPIDAAFHAWDEKKRYAVLLAFGLNAEHGDVWDTIRAVQSDSIEIALEAMWTALAPLLARQIKIYGTAEVAGRVYEHHGALLCELLEIPIDQLKAGADDAIPEPKSWKKEAAAQ